MLPNIIEPSILEYIAIYIDIINLDSLCQHAICTLIERTKHNVPILQCLQLVITLTINSKEFR